MDGQVLRSAGWEADRALQHRVASRKRPALSTGRCWQEQPPGRHERPVGLHFCSCHHFVPAEALPSCACTAAMARVWCCARLRHSMLPQPLAPPRRRSGIGNLIASLPGATAFSRVRHCKEFKSRFRFSVSPPESYYKTRVNLRFESGLPWAWSSCPAIRGIRCLRHEKQTTQTCLENRN